MLLPVSGAIPTREVELTLDPIACLALHALMELLSQVFNRSQYQLYGLTVSQTSNDGIETVSFRGDILAAGRSRKITASCILASYDHSWGPQKVEYDIAGEQKKHWNIYDLRRTSGPPYYQLRPQQEPIPIP